MSIENDLSSIAQSLAKIAEHLTASEPVVASSSNTAHVVHVSPTIERPTVQQSATPATPVAEKHTTLVTQAATYTVPTEVKIDAPFADHAALMTFVMDNYKALGPIKGAKIQDVLTSVGVKNINEVKPEHYAAIKAGVEALK